MNFMKLYTVTSFLWHVSRIVIVNRTCHTQMWPFFFRKPTEFTSYECVVFIYIKVKWSRYRPGVAQTVGRGIALLFHDRGTRRGWVVSSTPRPYFIPGKAPVPILQETEWAPGTVSKGGKSRPHRDSIPDRPARSQSLYRMSSPPIYIWHWENSVRATRARKRDFYKCH